MKSPIQVIKDMVKKYPNDQQLGDKVRFYIEWLYQEEKRQNY